MYEANEANEVDSKARADKARLEVLALVNEAQSLLYTATQKACPLQGWTQEWEKIGAHADATKALWHALNNAPRPTGHD